MAYPSESPSPGPQVIAYRFYAHKKVLDRMFVCLFDWSSNRWLFVFYFLGVTFRIFVQKNSSTGLFVCFSFLPFSSVYRELFVCHFLCVFDCHKRSNICFLSFFVCDFKNHCHKRSNSKHQADVNLRGKKPLSQVCFWHFCLFIVSIVCSFYSKCVMNGWPSRWRPSKTWSEGLKMATCQVLDFFCPTSLIF